MNKKELRSSYLAKRKKLSDQEIEALSLQIVLRFLKEIDLKGVQYVHCYLPMRDNKEINTHLLIKQLQAKNIKVLVPVADFEMHQMETALYEPTTELILRKGIPEPKEITPVDPQLIDLVVVPLAVFDKKGHRIGYGGGFYDRFLALLKHKPTLVGLSLFDAVATIATEEFDVPLDYCLTPTKAYCFSNK